MRFSIPIVVLVVIACVVVVAISVVCSAAVTGEGSRYKAEGQGHSGLTGGVQEVLRYGIQGGADSSTSFGRQGQRQGRDRGSRRATPTRQDSIPVSKQEVISVKC